MHTTDDRHGPGIRIHPPLIFATSILAGIGLDRVWPLAMPLGLHGKPLASALLAGVALVAVLCLREFYRARTDVRPDRPDRALITTGPYCFSRNPLYLMLALTQFAAAVWLDMAWVAVLLVVSLFVIHHYAVAREERYLEALFGQDYRDYKARVRRWI